MLIPYFGSKAKKQLGLREFKVCVEGPCAHGEKWPVWPHVIAYGCGPTYFDDGRSGSKTEQGIMIFSQVTAKEWEKDMVRLMQIGHSEYPEDLKMAVFLLNAMPLPDKSEGDDLQWEEQKKAFQQMFSLFGRGFVALASDSIPSKKDK